MALPRSVAQLQQGHVVLELESIDRLYLNAYVPKLTSAAGVAGFLRGHLGPRFASTKYAGEMTERFVANLRDFLQREDIELVRFQKGQRKDDVMQERLRRFQQSEGVVFVGVAQEQVRVPRTIRKHLSSGGTIPWIIYSTAMINVYYIYCLDRDFGPFFLKFASSFPYPAKLCLKRQLAQAGVAFEALDIWCRSAEHRAVRELDLEVRCAHLDDASAVGVLDDRALGNHHPARPRNARIVGGNLDRKQIHRCRCAPGLHSECQDDCSEGTQGTAACVIHGGTLSARGQVVNDEASGDGYRPACCGPGRQPESCQHGSGGGSLFNVKNNEVDHHLDTVRMVFMPHALDQVLRNPNAPILPKSRGLVARAILRNPQPRTAFQARFAELATNLFAAPVLT